MDDYYDDLYFGGGAGKDDGVACTNCGLSCDVGEDENGRRVLLDPTTQEKHGCCGTVQRPSARRKSIDGSSDAAGEVDYIDYK